MSSRHLKPQPEDFIAVRQRGVLLQRGWVTRSLTRLLVCLLLISSTGAPGWSVDRSRSAESNPYDKFRRLDDRARARGAMPVRDELAFAEMAHQEISKQYRFVNDPVIVNYINQVGCRVAEVSGRPNLPYQFYVVENDQINAFTPGGGRIYIHTGLIKQATTEGQLAAVLAHEVGHNVGYHLSATLRRTQTTGLIIGIAGILLGNGAVGQLGQLAVTLVAGGKLFQRSRDQEREADFLGLYDMHRAGYNTEEMNNMFRLLNSLMQRSPGMFDKIFASHPPPAERLQNTQREIMQHLVGSDRRGVRTTQAFMDIQRRLGVVGRAMPPTPDDDTWASSGDTTASPPVFEPATVRSREVTYEDAEEIFSRANLHGAVPLRAVRGDLLGGDTVGNDTVIAYEQGGRVGALVDVSGRIYPLLIEDRGQRTDWLPLAPREVSAVGIIPVSSRQRAQVVIVSQRRLRYVWEWTGRGFRSLSTQ
ncbi:MAG: M48 family metallopeptidase [Acidobacteriota bacterium]